MSKFNQLYKTILESINKSTIYLALSKLEDNGGNNDYIPQKKQNKFIQTYQKKLQQYATKINNAEYIETQEYTKLDFYINQILNILSIKGASKLALNKLHNILKECPNDVAQLYNNINILNIDTIKKHATYTKTFKFSSKFLSYLFDYKQLNKTTSTANIGRGQLLLALIINSAKINGLDDLSIGDRQYNVKYISKNHKNDNAIISVDPAKEPKLLAELVGKLKNYEFNKNKSEKSTLNFPTSENVKEQIDNFNDECKELENLLKPILRINLDKINDGNKVNGFILVGKDENSIKLRFLNSEYIIDNPLRFLNGLHPGEHHFGFYFKGKDLYPSNENEN